MDTQKIPFNDKCKKTTAYIALCAVIALLACFAAETSTAAIHASVTFVGDLAVLAMFTLYFAMTANAYAAAYPENRPVIFCAADCAALVLKIAFAALCAKSGGVMIHAAALIINVIFSRVYALKYIQN